MATARGGIPEAVEHGSTGVFVEPDAAGMADAIRTILERPEVAARLGRAAWHRARTVFSPGRCTDGYDALLRQVASHAGAA